MRTAQTIIVGGGIWGLSTAYHLARSGAQDVLVLERGSELAAETTSQASGLVGQIRSTPVMVRAIQYCLQLLEELADQTGSELGFHRSGSLFVALTQRRAEAFEREVEAGNQHGIGAELVGVDQMRRLAPDLNTSGVLSGYFVPGDGYVQPQRVALAYAAGAEELGVRIERNTVVTDVECKHGKVQAVQTSKGRHEAAQVVLASGPWTGVIAAKAGFTVPAVPIRHQRVRTAPTGKPVSSHHPVVRVPELSCYLRPEQGGYLYGFFEPRPTSLDLTVQPTLRTGDIEPPIAVMDEARQRMMGVFPVLAHLKVTERHQGLTSFAPDGAYVLGPVPAVRGLFVASGCAALGIAGSAAVGRWLSGWILAGDPGEDLSAFSPDRFAEQVHNSEQFSNVCRNFYAGYYALG